MRYYLNCQQVDGDLISLALVREDGRSLYIVLPHDPHSEKPGAQELFAVLKNTPESPVWPTSREVAAVGIYAFLVEGGVLRELWGLADHLHALGLLLGPLADLMEPRHVAPVETNPRVPTNAWWEAVSLAEKLGAELGG